MSRYPWRNTSEDIAAEAESQWETPGGAQEKADAAEQAAKDYSDEKLNEHIGTGGAAHAVVVAGGAAGFMAGADKTKLDGVAAGANNYVHPATHPPSIIAQDTNNRFVTDAEKADWNAKAPSTLATSITNGLMPATDKDKLDKATSAPTASTIIARDASGRAQVAAPSASSDIARKAETDAVQTNLNTHASDADVHVTAADHAKLDGIQLGAEVNQNAFSAVNGVSATSKTDTLQITGGTGITITEDVPNKRVTVTATGSATPGAHASSHVTGGTDVIPNAVTNGSSGLMSGTDAQFVRIEGETKSGAQNKADAALVAANEYTDGKVAEIVIDDASLTQKGVVQLSNATGSSSQTEAATPKAVNDARLAAATDATTKANTVQTALDNHANSNAATSEPHGMRVRSGKLEYYNGSVWAAASSGLDLSTNVINYYVNATAGNDSNDGLTAGQAFKTINKALSLVPSVFNNEIAINIAAGTYPENIIISNKFGTGMLKIFGPSSGSPAVISGFIDVKGSTLSNIEFRYLTINQGSSVSPVSASYVDVLNLLSLTMTATSTQPGLYALYSDVQAFNCTISNKAYGIRASTLAKVYSNSMLGSGNNIGLYADSAGEIVKFGTQPSGTTAERTDNGGLIRS